MKNRSIIPMRIAKYGYVLISAAFCVLGILLIVYPSVVVPMAWSFIGIGLTVFGIIKIIGYFSKDLYRLAFQFDLQFGILFLILGILTLIRPQGTLDFLCGNLGILILIESLFKFKVVRDARSFGIRDWWVTCLMAGLSSLAGLLLMFQPAFALNTLTSCLGIAILLEGGMNVVVALRYVKIIKNQKPDFIDVDYVDV